MSAVLSTEPPISITVAVADVLGSTIDGGAVFSAETSDGKRVRVVASPRVLPRPPLPGESWRIVGQFENHSVYGKQLVAAACAFQLPAGKLLVQYLSKSPHFAGIGAAKAQALWDKFGDQLERVLGNGDRASLEIVLTPTMAERLVDAWSARLPEAELMAFLDEHGFDLRLANRMFRVWGDKARNMIDLNPYYMLAFAGWSTVDLAALKLRVGSDDPRRLVGAVESVLYDRLQLSHTLTSHEKLLRLVQRKLPGCNSSQAVALAVDELAVTKSTRGYQPAGAAALERGIERRLRAMMAGESADQGTLFESGSDEEHDHEISLAAVEREQGFALNAEQRSGVVMPFMNPFSLLTGGAGVGKTTVLRAIIRIAQAKHMAVVQMALAGRAAKRMSESTGYPAMTIARFLGQAKAGQLELDGDGLIVVDEASMLDLPTMYRILRFLPDGAHLLLVGDPAQLAPIGFGLVFHRLVASKAVPQTHLLQVHRQAESTGIPAAALHVRNHVPLDLVPYTGRRPGVSFIACQEFDVVMTLRRLAADWQGDEWQALAATKGGHAGTNMINKTFHTWRTGEIDGPAFVEGEPVIHLVNDYERGLMNGTLGQVVEATGTGVSIQFEGSIQTFDWGTARDRIEHAYAISVHKAQGSQFKRVAVVSIKSRLLDHALLYTGLTRGIEQVVFVGDYEAFKNAVLKPPLAHLREVAFSV